MEEITLSFHGMEDLPYVRSSVSHFLQQHLPADYAIMEFAIIEALNNAVQHGNKNCPSCSIHLRMRISSKLTLSVRIRDQGEGFPGNFLLNKARESSKDPYEEIMFNESGRGLLIMNSITDRILYNQYGNEVLLIKRSTSKRQQPSVSSLHR